jgi:hypothetical protein
MKSIEIPFIREPEFRTIGDAIKEMSIVNAIILSETNEYEITLGGVPVKVQSITEWLVKQ